jgi:hypothetical protein
LRAPLPAQHHPERHHNSAPDSDNDGIPDDWEIANGFSPTNAADALLDTDNDGAINRDEYVRREPIRAIRPAF